MQTRSAGRVAHRYLNLQIFFLSGISGACVLLWNYCVPRYCYMYCRSDCGAVLDLSTNLGSSFRLRNHSHLVKDLRFSPTKRLNRAHTVVNTRYWGRLNRDNKSGKTPLPFTPCSLSLFVSASMQSVSVYVGAAAIVAAVAVVLLRRRRAAAAADGKGKHKVFVYGSLLGGLHNNHHLGTSRLLQPGVQTQDSYVLLKAAEDEGYPFAIKSSDLPGMASSLLGEVYEVTDRVLASLDVLEGHPSIYRREEVQYLDANKEGSKKETAWMYLLYDRTEIGKIRDAIQSGREEQYPLVQPLGDWRTFHHVARGDVDVALAAAARRAAAWPSTRRTAKTACGGSAGPHALFSYGSNGIAQLRERCKNPNLTGTPAMLEDSVRVFAGCPASWGGGVASIIPCPGMRVLGNVVWLSKKELKLLDRFERGGRVQVDLVAAGVKFLADDPYAPDGTYRRQDLVVRCLPTSDEAGADAPTSASNAGSWPQLQAVAYVRVNLDWQGPPTPTYMAACRANVDAFWPDQAQLPFEVRDGSGRLMAVMSET